MPTKIKLAGFWEDIQRTIGDISNVSGQIASTYSNLVQAGIITPAYQAPPTPVTIQIPSGVPGVTPVIPGTTVSGEKFYEKSWFLPVVIASGIAGGTGLLLWGLKKS